MLKLKHLFANFELAEEALKYWAHDAHNLRETFAQFRISANAIYPFFSNDNICFLRLAPIDEKVENNIIGEIEFLLFLREHDYPANEPIKSLSGQYLHTLHTPWGDYYACVFRCVQGVRLDHTDFSDNMMLAYGKSLGQLHRLSSLFVPNVSKWSYVDALDWIEQTLTTYHASENVCLELQSLRLSLSTLPKNDTVYGLVHYDFEPDNVFFDAETGQCNIIDFDDGMMHWYALDIEQAIGELRDILGESGSEHAIDQFLLGYKQEHVLTAEMSASLPLMRRFIDLYRYSRIIRSVAETIPNEPEWMTQLRSFIGSMMCEYEEGQA